MTLQVRVLVSSISGERFWDFEAQLPPNLQIAMNMNVLSLEGKGDNRLHGSFLLVAQYTPSIGQLSARGRVLVEGNKQELDELKKSIEERKPPLVLLQSVNNFVMGELILISKVIGVPPPLPTLMPPGGAQLEDSAGHVVI